jgi:hypothetical protein
MVTYAVQAAKCCCACWYRIPLCPCENDPETWPLYIPCDILEAFFDAHPELGNHLIFAWWAPDASDNTLCYEMREDETLKVSEIPPDPPAIILDGPPDEATWFPPPFDDCRYCCPNPCCPACWGRPDHGACCWLPPADESFARVHMSAVQVRQYCCIPALGFNITFCSEETVIGAYDLVGCDGVGALWIKRPGEPNCLWDWWLFTCYPGPGTGWTNSEDMECNQPCVTYGDTCIDILPFCCPKEGEEPGQPVGGFFPWCVPNVSDDPPGHPCAGAAWGWNCMYATAIDCPGWGGGDPGELCTCGWQSLTLEFHTPVECEFVGDGYPDGACFPPD